MVNDESIIRTSAKNLCLYVSRASAALKHLRAARALFMAYCLNGVAKCHSDGLPEDGGEADEKRGAAS